MGVLDISCWCVGCVLIIMIMWLSFQNSNSQILGSHAQTQGKIHHSSARGVHEDTEFDEEVKTEQNKKLLSDFSWDSAATKATEGWNIPTLDGAKAGQTIQSGRLEKPQIRPCRLPGIDSVGALRPRIKPIPAGDSCVSWGDSECRLSAIDSETGCFGDSPDCGIASR
jgi:hypothetical protein